MSSLAERVQEMELEANDLRTKLRMENSKAHHDPLTGLANRLAYDERLAQEVARWKRFNKPLTLLIWDIDHFKSVNDRFGHSAGDKVLKIIAAELSAGIRETDFVCRFGGEEFVMLLPGAAMQSAMEVANNLREKIKACQFNSGGKSVAITVSCGLCEFTAGTGPEEVFEQADKALYGAKDQGRDQCQSG